MSNLPIACQKGEMVWILGVELETEPNLLGDNCIAFKTDAVMFPCTSDGAIDILSHVKVCCCSFGAPGRMMRVKMSEHVCKPKSDPWEA